VGRGPRRSGRARDDARGRREGPRRGVVGGAFEIEDDWVDVGQREQLARAREGG
jgi:hypothetical protein